MKNNFLLLIILATLSSFANAEMINVASSENGGTATAISEGTYLSITRYASYVNDDDLSTFWASHWDMPAWVQIEFEQVNVIEKVAVQIDQHQQTFSISLSEDGVNWTEVVSPTLSQNAPDSISPYDDADPSYESFDIDPISAKFMRVNITTTTAPGSHIFKAIVSEMRAYTHGLLAHYQFEGNADDSSGFERHATAYNDYQYVNGILGQGIMLTGSGHTGLNGGHVILPFIPLNEYPEFSISIWVNPIGDTTNSGEAFISFGTSGPGDAPIGQKVHVICHLTDGPYGDRTLSMVVGEGEEIGLVEIDTELRNQWSHFVMSCHQGVLSAYWNGELIGQDDYELGPMVENAAIGAHWWSTSSSSNRFIGTVDDVRIYSKAISDADVKELYKSAITQYHVDTVSGNDGNDGLTKETAFATIQHGIGQTDHLDTINVWPGTYEEGCDFLGKAITVTSAADAAVVRNPSGYAFSFSTGEQEDSILSNLVLADGLYGIYADTGCKPTLKNLTIANNDFGISCHANADPNITNCILANDTGDLDNCDAQYSWVKNQLGNSTNGLIAYYPFEGNADDVSGNGHSGVIVGVEVDFTGGVVGQAVTFLGDDDHIEISSESSFELGSEFSISLWVNINDWSQPGGGWIISKHLAFQNDTGWQLNYGDGHFIWYQYGQDAMTSSLIDPNKNQNIIISSSESGNYTRIYIDGELDSSTGFMGAPISNSYPIYIGSHYGLADREIDGMVDELRVYDRALTELEIQQQYTRELLGYGIGDPVFVRPESGDYHLKSEKGHYFPAPASDPNMFGEDIDGAWVMDTVTSPCVDAGDPTENPSNEGDPNGGRVNQGAYGNTAYSSHSEWPLAHDTNRDGIVNLADFATFASEWLSTLPWVE